MESIQIETHVGTVRMRFDASPPENPALQEWLDDVARRIAEAVDREMYAMLDGGQVGSLGHSDDALIPDTPLDEWNAKGDVLLKECEAHNPFVAL